MVLKYILGRSGTGKTTEVLKQIIEHEDENKNIIYIVPEQFSLQSEKDILNLTPNKYTTLVNVLSFKRLAFNVLSETGAKKVKLLDDVSKIMLIRKILLNLNDKLIFFKKTKITEGFITKLSDSISELYKYGVTPNDLIQVANNLNSNENLVIKIQDIYLIYNQYRSYIEDRYISTDGALDVLSDNINKSILLENSEVWIDGFNGFTNQEYNVIKELMKKVNNITISLTIDDTFIYYDNIIETDVFYETKYTINKITSLANECGIEINKPLFLEENKRHKSNANLKYLEKNIFSLNFKPYTEEVDNIKIQPLLNIFEEISYVAEEITALVRDKGYSYSDIAILTPNIHMYKKNINSIFSKHSIPFFIDANEDMLSHPLFEFIRAIFDIIIQNWTYESVFRFLKTGMTDISLKEIDILENYVLAYGITGYRWKLEEWKYGFNSNYENFNKQVIHNVKEKIVNYILPFEKIFIKKTKSTVKEISIEFFKMLYSMNILEAMNKLINEAIEEENVELVSAHRQVWDKLCDIFEKTVNILGEEKVSIQEFSTIVESGILTTTMGMIPPTQDKIIVGDISRSRLPNIKVLFIIGVNEGIFPRPKVDEDLLTDHERLLVNSLGVELGPTSVRRAFEEKFLTYISLCKASELLNLTYSQSGIDGKAMLPAFIIRSIKSIFSSLIVKENNELQISNPNPMLSKLGIALKNYYEKGEITDSYLELYKWFKENKVSDLTKIEEIAKNGNKLENLNTNSINKLYGKEINITISKLEQYVRCPFAFFVNYNLKAKERKIYKISNIDLGEIFHNVLEKVTAIILKNNLSFKELTQDEINNYTDICIDDIIKNLDKDIFFSSMSSKYILERIRRISKKSIWALCEHIKRGKFSIYGTEVSFGGDSPLTGIIVEIDKNRKFVFTGRVDRIDIMDANGNKYVKIIDYKSGNKKFDITDIYYGMEMQLIVYLNNIVKRGGKYFGIDKNTKILPGGIFYFKVDDPILNIDNKSIKEDLEKAILKSFKMSGLLLNQEDVINGIDRDIIGSSVIVPVTVNKDGSYSSSSSIADESMFDNFMEVTLNKIKDIGKNITNGYVEPFPFKKGSINACMYCNYKSICSFDPKDNEKYKYNIFNIKSSLSDLK